MVDQRLSPLYVSIHATDPDVRSRMLRNRRGAISLRWLRCLLDHGIEVHGQVVVCPGLNDGAVLHQTLAGVLDRFPELVTAAVVPLGVSRYSNEPAMRPAHRRGGAGDRRHRAGVAAALHAAPSDAGSSGPRTSTTCSQACDYRRRGVRRVPAARERRRHGSGLRAGLRLQAAGAAGHEGAPGTDRVLRLGRGGAGRGLPGAPHEPGAHRRLDRDAARAHEPVTILTGAYGGHVLAPVLDRSGFGRARVLTVRNDFFGGNIAVAGLITGSDLARHSAEQPDGGRYLLPDVCLSKGRFIDGSVARGPAPARRGRRYRRGVAPPRLLEAAR